MMPFGVAAPRPDPGMMPFGVAAPPDAIVMRGQVAVPETSAPAASAQAAPCLAGASAGFWAA